MLGKILGEAFQQWGIQRRNKAKWKEKRSTKQPVLSRIVDVVPETKIHMVEFNLAQLRLTNPYDWMGMFSDWLDVGAKLDLYVQDINPGSIFNLNESLSKHATLNLYDFSKMQESDDENEVKLASSLRNFHFTVFEDPNQYWVERNHPQGSHLAYGCELVDGDHERQIGGYRHLLEHFSVIGRFAERLSTDDLSVRSYHASLAS